MPYPVHKYIQIPKYIQVPQSSKYPSLCLIPCTSTFKYLNPMPYPVHKYIQIPKYIQVPQSILNPMPYPVHKYIQVPQSSKYSILCLILCTSIFKYPSIFKCLNLVSTQTYGAISFLQVQIEKPYFVEVTKHIAVPVAVPVPKPMPYPVHKYIQIPKYIQVPQSSVDHTGGTQERSTTASLSPRPTRPPSPPSYSTTPHPYSFDYPYYTPEHLPQVSIHPNGVSPSPTPSQDYMLQLLEQKSHQGALTLEELQQLMQSEKLPDDPFIIKK
ncbi:uncharacterized protein LOC103507375 [Diaphorina citri]|uniref:Uncharacterized protein LOC103507375 n=1 Tax=Diaphorina citri TaxID=121845 RepID=A0A3Q0IP25_DIACI|nr:uncharacterized protein LOC103507375 [Diaphorina citri]